MIIPDCLNKYKKFLENSPAMDSISVDRLSDNLLAHINKSNDGKLCLKMKKDYKDFEYFIPKLEDIPNCFLGNVWNNSTLEEKIKIIDRYLDYFFQSNPKIRPKLQLLPKTQEEKNGINLGYFSKNSKRIYIDLDQLINSSGINLLSVLYHECTHVKDFHYIESEILPEILSEFTEVSGEMLDHPALCDQYVMRMKSSGILKNNITGRDCRITDKLQRDILRAKNYYSIFQSTGIDSCDQVKTKEDFKKYLESILYFYSPVERFARISVRNFFKKQLTNLNYSSPIDLLFMYEQAKSEEKIDKILDEFKELLHFNGETIIDMKDLLDLAMRNKFYQKPSFVGKSNAEKFPEEATRVLRTYNKKIDELYANLLTKRMFKKDDSLSFDETPCTREPDDLLM